MTTKTGKIQRVIYSEITAPSLISLVVLTFVVFTREFGRLAEILIRKNAATATIFQIVISLLPSILIFTVPFAFLIGTLIGISRLSADSEIIALRAGGVNIYQLLWPVLKVGLGIMLLTLILTCILLPRANSALRDLRHQIGLRPVQSEIKAHVFNEDLPGVVLYAEDIDLQTSAWQGAFLADASTDGEKRIILSQRAHPLFSDDAQRLQIHFERGLVYKVDLQSPERTSLTRFQTLDVPVEFPEVVQADASPKQVQDKTVAELFSDIGEEDSLTSHMGLVEFQRRLALPLSALIFAVLALTLGIHSPRAGRGYGFILSIAIAFTYYVLFATGIELAENGTISITVGVWGANLLLGFAALGSLRYSEATPGLLSNLGNNILLLHLVHKIKRVVARFLHFLRGIYQLIQTKASNFPNLDFRLARVVDLYVIRKCLLYSFLTLSVCASLFYLFTFFELIEDIFENDVPYTRVVDYFFYLLPHILILLVPISILIATLVTLGLLDRTNQVTALKACGVSVYRLTVPILAVALTMSAFLFLMQEYLLPYANQRQDNLRDIIKGHPVQTYYQLGHNWIFGEENWLYNYNYFDPANDVFADITVYQLNIGENQLWRHLYARRAAWDSTTNRWQLQNGWERTFQNSSVQFETFEERYSTAIAEPSYFEKEVKESSKMTYVELKDYIGALQQGGFEVDHLKTELYRKISFPIVTFIMAILGIPFAFSIGRKGALYGIATAVLIGIAYWGTFGLFSLLGSNGMLSPMLAAWGPNILFGAGGALLLSTVRT